VAKLITQGKTISPDSAKINQLFSHRHPGMSFIGAAKLPFRIPASVTTPIPDSSVRCIQSPK
jgi:hypothetical protein